MPATVALGNEAVVYTACQRDGGADWTAGGFFLARSDATDPRKVAVASVRGEYCAGVVDDDHAGAEDGHEAAMVTGGQYTLQVADAEVIALEDELTNDASGRAVVAAATETVHAIALGTTAGGTGQTVVARLMIGPPSQVAP